jgi:hypothetical protein
MRIRRSKTIITSEAVMIAAGMPWHRITAIVATIRPRPTFICKVRIGCITLHNFHARMMKLSEIHLVALVGV